MQHLATIGKQRYTSRMPTAPNPCDPDLGPDDFEDPPAPAVAPSEVEASAVLPRRCPIDWEHTRLTPAFVRALAKAQREARTVGKDSKIEAREGTKARNYADGDAMTEEATRVFSDNGIAWVTASVHREATEKMYLDENGDKQWVCSVVEMTSILMHAPPADAEGLPDHVGTLVTYGETASIGRSSTPIDKANKAGESYLRLYMARDLAALDRGIVNDNVDDRPEDDAGPRRGTQRPAAPSDDRVFRAKRAAEARWKPLSVLMQQRDGKPPNVIEWMFAALGDRDPITAEDWGEVHRLIGVAIDEINASTKGKR